VIIVKGDVNLDGRIDGEDLLLLWLMLNNAVPLVGGTPQFIAADVAGTPNVVTYEDYNAILDHIKGIKMITEVVEIDGAQQILQL
jgi:hypothetical protein